jgi:hypothetical protein
MVRGNWDIRYPGRSMIVTAYLHLELSFSLLLQHHLIVAQGTFCFVDRSEVKAYVYGVSCCFGGKGKRT